jgi:condensin complex subunit 2
MARSVRSRGPSVKAPTYAESDDSGGDTETEEQDWNEHSANGAGKASSSRPKGKAPSKRTIRTDHGDKENAADGYAPNGAGPSGSGGKTAVGLKRQETVGKFNDDEAEKRKRRKSAKLLGQQTTMFDGLTDPGPGANGLNTGKQPVQLNSVVPAAPIINVPRDVMNSNFEEWMKMATDNVSTRILSYGYGSVRVHRWLTTGPVSFVFLQKINANNSWNFALIDYFHDMSLLRNNTDNSINFQRASCTLDGCVKIWTSRVDSVNDETNKLLRGVRDGPGGGDSENEDDQDGGDGGPGSQRTQRKGAHRAEVTLAKSAAQLRSKKLDLEFSVDPLFKKTCADFDEGGAHGLLMNHLSLGVGIDGGGLRVVFDASDAVAKSGDDEEADEVEPAETVDLSELRGRVALRGILGSLTDAFLP